MATRSKYSVSGAATWETRLVAAPPEPTPADSSTPDPLPSSPVTTAQLDAGLDDVRSAPADRGRVELIVARPATDRRTLLDRGRLDPAVGLVVDTWAERPSSRTADGSAHPDMALTLMNARFARLLAGEPHRWALAGDQLYVDLDLSTANLPPGTRLSVGEAVVEITDQPHTGCAKFRRRFGADALRYVNAPEGRRLNLRGVNARVLEGGRVAVGDVIEKATG